MAALNRNLLAALALDLAIPPVELGKPHALSEGAWSPSAEALRAKCKNLETRAIWARDIVLPQRTGPLVLLALTYSLLARLPVTWAENVVAWAPPVVSARKPYLWGICGNLTSAWIAHARLIDAKVPVRMAEQKRFFPPIVDLSQICPLVCIALPRFMGVCEGLKQEIADFSDGVISGQWENQLRRAMTYRYRQRARNEREAARSSAEGAREPEGRSGWRIDSHLAGTIMPPGALGTAAPSGDEQDAHADE